MGTGGVAGASPVASAGDEGAGECVGDGGAADGATDDTLASPLLGVSVCRTSQSICLYCEIKGVKYINCDG